MPAPAVAAAACAAIGVVLAADGDACEAADGDAREASDSRATLQGEANSLSSS
jgi:hypothetical protein